MLNSLGTLVEAHRGAEFELGRQGDPKLKAARPCRLAGTAAMPHAAAGLHPLDAAGGQQAGCAVRVFILHTALGEVGEGRDARMRVQPEALEGDSIVVKEIEEHERLQKPAEVRRAHQTGYGSIAGTPGAPNDLTYRLSRDWCGKGHSGFLGVFGENAAGLVRYPSGSISSRQMTLDRAPREKARCSRLSRTPVKYRT